VYVPRFSLAHAYNALACVSNLDEYDESDLNTMEAAANAAAVSPNKSEP